MCLDFVSLRDGKYIPLPQRQRELNRERAERGSGGPPPHSRLSGGYRPSPTSSSPRPPLSSAAGPQPGVSPSDRSSPLSSRGGAYTPHHPQGSPSPGSGAASPYTPASPGGAASTSASASNATSPSSPPAPHGHAVPHSHSLPLSLADAGRSINGGELIVRNCFSCCVACSRSLRCILCPSVSVRTSPKAQRPPQSSRTNRTPSFHPQPTGTVAAMFSCQLFLNYFIYIYIYWYIFIAAFCLSIFCLFVLAAVRSPKSGSSQDTPYLDTSSVSLPSQKTSGPSPLFPVDGNVSHYALFIFVQACFGLPELACSPSSRRALIQFWQELEDSSFFPFVVRNSHKRLAFFFKTLNLYLILTWQDLHCQWHVVYLWQAR